MKNRANEEVGTPLDPPNPNSQPKAGDAQSLPSATIADPAGQPKPRDTWDKADILGKLLSSILVPVALAAAGFYINFELEKRAEKQKQVEIVSAAKLKTQEIAITVLQAKETPLPDVKDWALKVFAEMASAAGQPLSNKAFDDLHNNPLPSSNAGAAAIAADFSGFSSRPYQDVRGIWTIGFGHTNGVGPDTSPITLEQASALLKVDMQPVGDAVDRLVNVPITSDQRDTLVDLAFSIGITNFSSSTLLRELNSGNCDKARDSFMMWTRGNKDGQVQQIPGLVRQRERELQLWKCSGAVQQ